MSKKVLNIFSDSDLTVLENLRKHIDLHITRPDNGKGVVRLNKHDYLDKVERMLNDSKTCICWPHDNLSTKMLKVEDKVNRALTKLKNKSFITDTEYKHSIYYQGITWHFIGTHKNSQIK